VPAPLSRKATSLKPLVPNPAVTGSDKPGPVGRLPRGDWRAVRLRQGLRSLLRQRELLQEHLSDRAWRIMGLLFGGSLLCWTIGGLLVGLTTHVVFGAILAVLGTMLLLAGFAMSMATLVRAQAERTAGEILDRVEESLDRPLAAAGSEAALAEGLSAPGLGRMLRSGPPLEIEELAGLRQADQRLVELYRKRTEAIWQKLLTKRYFSPDGRVADRKEIWAEIDGITREVASLYHVNAADSLIEARCGQVLLTLSHIFGRLHELIALPVVDLRQKSIREILELLQRVARLRQAGQLISDYSPYFRPVYYVGRVWFGANPLGLIASYLASEAATRVLKNKAEQWLMGLLDQFVWTLYVHLAMIYGGLPGNRSAESLAYAHVIAVHSAVQGIDANRRVLEERILAADLWNDYDRLELLKALAKNDASVLGPIDAHLKALVELLDDAERNQLADLVAETLSQLRGLRAPRAVAAIHKLERILGRGLAVDYGHSGQTWEVRAEDGWHALALLARVEGGLDRDAAAQLLGAAAFTKKASEGDAPHGARLLERALHAAYTPRLSRRPEVPLSLAGTELAPPFLDAVLELCDRPEGPWTESQDRYVVQAITVLLIDKPAMDAAWKRHLKRAEARLKALAPRPLLQEVDERSARQVLRCLRPGDTLLAAVTGHLEAPDGQECWIALLKDRIHVGRRSAEMGWRGPAQAEEVPVTQLWPERLPGRIADDLALAWPGRKVTVPGVKVGSFERRFGELLREMGLEPPGRTLPQLPAPSPG
jgi:hypothetical protein